MEPTKKTSQEFQPWSVSLRESFFHHWHDGLSATIRVFDLLHCIVLCGPVTGYTRKISDLTLPGAKQRLFIQVFPPNSKYLTLINEFLKGRFSIKKNAIYELPFFAAPAEKEQNFPYIFWENISFILSNFFLGMPRLWNRLIQ